MPKDLAVDNVVDVAFLSVTEEQVLNAFADGLRRGQIARSLNISERTVGHALTVAKEKLSARSLAHAAVIYRSSQPAHD
jgi:DNA-binding NarL/FixJ family response regulator